MNWKWIAGAIVAFVLMVGGGLVAMVKMDPTAKVRAGVEKLWKTPEGKLKYPGSTPLQATTGSTVSGGSAEIISRFGTDDDDEKVLQFYSETLTSMGWQRMKPGDGKGPVVRELGWWTKMNFVFLLDATGLPTEIDGTVIDKGYRSVITVTMAERTYFGPPRKRRGQ